MKAQNATLDLSCTVADCLQIYKDPPASKPDSGYGFIVELDQLEKKKPKKYVMTT